jgi:hypothetical protein
MVMLLDGEMRGIRRAGILNGSGIEIHAPTLAEPEA